MIAGLFAWMACTSAPEGTTLNVYAASSLTDAFREMETIFEQAHPDVDVVLHFAGSQVLRLQVEQGAMADVFASANAAHFNALTVSGLMTSGQVFTHNELVVIVPRDNPAGVQQFSDLLRAERLVIGAYTAPVGQYTRAVLAQASAQYGEDFSAHVVSEEQNVRLVRAKVALGEADAAIVYRTDVTDAVDVIPVEIPAAWNVEAAYLIGALSEAPQPQWAARWIDVVRSDVGEAVLTRHGFLSVE